MSTSSKTAEIRAADRRVKPVDSKVEHFYWTDHMQAAAEMGVQMRSLCGVWADPVDREYAKKPDRVTLTKDSHRVVAETADCKRCIRVLNSCHGRRQRP